MSRNPGKNHSNAEIFAVFRKKDNYVVMEPQRIALVVAAKHHFTPYLIRPIAVPGFRKSKMVVLSVSLIGPPDRTGFSSNAPSWKTIVTL